MTPATTITDLAKEAQELDIIVRGRDATTAQKLRLIALRRKLKKKQK